MSTVRDRDDAHLAVLDGWRGISVLAILACHLLPLGPKDWQLNDMAGPLGMAVFFTLSGFLICRFLLHRPDIPAFLIRRGFRILPLAWVAMVVVLVMENSPASMWWANLLFYANLPPQQLTHAGSHLWSLCVEVQFYVAVALVVAIGGRRALMLLPLAALAITVHRIGDGATVDIVTWQRGDEILAGVTLALIYEGRFGIRARAWAARLPAWPLLALLLLASHPAFEALNYARPYIAAALVGSSLLAPRPAWQRFLSTRWLAYVAATSYALYVIHHILVDTWLGSGDTFERYLKRPLLFAATFALAHVSTFRFEQPMIALGKRLEQRWVARRRQRAADAAPESR